MLVLMGSSIYEASKRMHVKQEDIQQALQDQKMVEMAEEIKNRYRVKPTPKSQWGDNVWGIENKNDKQQNTQVNNKNESKFPSETLSKLKSRISQMGEGSDWDILSKVADEYGLQGQARQLLYAIRIIENGRPGLEMGCGDGTPNHPARRKAGDHNESLHLQAQWAAGTIKKRFEGDIEKFAQIYCNENWENWSKMAKRLIGEV